MAEKRKPKTITDKNVIEKLLNITEKDFTTEFMNEIFGEFDNKAIAHSYDIITIPAGYYGPEGNKNVNAFNTTVGRWVFNKFFIEQELFEVFGYFNQTINKKSSGAINNKLSYAVLEDDIPVSYLKNYMMKTQKIMPFVSVLSPSHTLKMLLCSKEIEKKKKQLLNKYAKEIAEGNDVVGSMIENELVKFAEEYLDGDPSLDSYLSGARGSMGNNFKNMFIMKGVYKEADPNKGYKILSSNYIDGMRKDEYASFAESLSTGPYKRACKTAIGGYWEKLYVSAFQHVTLDKVGSDCGTKRTVTVKLDNPSDWMYSYIVEGSKLVELNSKNMDKYKGKTVKLRFSSMCESKTGYCNKCAGNLFYKLGITNIGMAAPMIPSKLKTLSMKGFHDSSVKLTEMDPMRVFGIK